MRIGRKHIAAITVVGLIFIYASFEFVAEFEKEDFHWSTTAEINDSIVIRDNCLRLPSSAKNINLRIDIDSRWVWASFEYDNVSDSLAVRQMHQLTAQEASEVRLLKPRSARLWPKLRWWNKQITQQNVRDGSILKKYTLYRCNHPWDNGGGRRIGYYLVPIKGGNVYYWAYRS